MIKLLNIFAGVCLTVVAPLIAHAAPTTAPVAVDRPGDDDRVSVPFAPPVGQPLRYRVSREVTKNGATNSTWAVNEAVFSRRDEGYRLQIRGIDMDPTGNEPAAQEAHRRTLRELDPPFVLLVSEDGELEGMENDEAYWSQVMDLVRARMARTTPPGPNSAAATELAIGMIRDTTPEGRLALITQSVAPIFEYGATALTPGEEIADEIEGPGMMGLTLRYQVRIRPERVENNHLFISVRTTVPREELVRATEQFVARVPVTGRSNDDDAGRARFLAELRSAEFSRLVEASYEIDLETGLTLRHRSEDRTTFRSGSESGTRVTTMTIERLD